MNGMDFTLLFRILSGIGISVSLFFTGWSVFLLKRDLMRVRDIIYNIIKLKPWLYRGAFIALLMAKIQVYGLTAIFTLLIAMQLLINIKSEKDVFPFFVFGAILFLIGYWASQNRNDLK
jgi:hypothetical protein